MNSEPKKTSNTDLPKILPVKRSKKTKLNNSKPTSQELRTPLKEETPWWLPNQLTRSTKPLKKTLRSNQSKPLRSKSPKPCITMIRMQLSKLLKSSKKTSRKKKNSSKMKKKTSRKPRNQSRSSVKKTSSKKKLKKKGKNSKKTSAKTRTSVLMLTRKSRKPMRLLKKEMSSSSKRSQKKPRNYSMKMKSTYRNLATPLTAKPKTSTKPSKP